MSDPASLVPLLILLVGFMTGWMIWLTVKGHVLHTNFVVLVGVVRYLARWHEGDLGKMGRNKDEREQLEKIRSWIKSQEDACE